MNDEQLLPTERKSLGLDIDTYERLKALADEDGRSMIGELRWLIYHEEKDRSKEGEK